MTGRTLTRLTSSPTHITATIVFSPDFPGLDGHFPHHPIVPGFCHLDAILALLNAQPARIDEAKLTRALLPNEVAHIAIELAHPQAAAELTTANGDRISRFVITLAAS